MYVCDLILELEMETIKGMSRSYPKKTVGKNYTDFHIFLFFLLHISAISFYV